jgi:hypothetical protein
MMISVTNEQVTIGEDFGMNTKLTGIILILGSLLFIIAAFSPITIAVVTEADIGKRADTLAEGQAAWFLVNLLFAVGSLITAFGLWLFAFQVSLSRRLKVLSYLSALCFAIATILWLYICVYRVSYSTEEVASNLIVNSLAFSAYTLLSQGALILLGFILLQSDYPRWLGRGILLLACLSLLAYLVFKDMPPFAYYVLLFLTGFGLLRWHPKQGLQEGIA